MTDPEGWRILGMSFVCLHFCKLFLTCMVPLESVKSNFCDNGLNKCQQIKNDLDYWEVVSSSKSN